MGMFSARQKKAPAATLCYISSKLRAQKNKTVDYLDSLPEEKRKSIMKMAVPYAKQKRQRRKKLQKKLMVELSKRQADKQQARDTTAPDKLEKKLKSMRLDAVPDEFPQLNQDQLDDFTELLTGKAIGREIFHAWYEDGKQVWYMGQLKSVFGSGKRKKYEVAYWGDSETLADAVDYEMPLSALAADFLMEDLKM